MRILGIESSCDETSAAVVEDGRKVLSNIISSQIDIHARFGGVVPEVASRRHLEAVIPTVREALEKAECTWDDIDAVAVTNRPGLIGSLIVGVMAAKTIAYAKNKPLLAVHHLEGHIYANFLTDFVVEFPVVCLVVSGGHSDMIYMPEHGKYELLAKTVDDAAGEAFDKCARALGLGYPGGPIIDKMAKKGNPKAVRFPRARVKDTLDFSFSGLKTAVVRYAESSEDDIKDITASFQAAVVDVLVSHTFKAARERGVKQVLVAGGVAANSGLKNAMTEKGKRTGIAVSVPPMVLCTDNAAMIAAAAYYNYDKYLTHDLRLDCKASEPIGL